jgi:NADH-quinone oxidoreductase subunit K
MIVSLPSFLTVGALLFFIGLYMTLVRKNMVSMLMGLELILNGAALNFASFAYYESHFSGFMMVIFIIALAAMETVIALAIIFSIFKQFRTTMIDRASALKD